MDSACEAGCVDGRVSSAGVARRDSVNEEPCDGLLVGFGEKEGEIETVRMPSVVRPTNFDSVEVGWDIVLCVCLQEAKSSGNLFVNSSDIQQILLKLWRGKLNDDRRWLLV